MSEKNIDNKYVVVLEVESDNYGYMGFKIVEDNVEDKIQIWKGYDKDLLTFFGSVRLHDFLALCSKFLNVHALKHINEKYKKLSEITDNKKMFSYDEHHSQKTE